MNTRRRCYAVFALLALMCCGVWAKPSSMKGTIVQVIKQAPTNIPYPAKTGTEVVPAFPNYQVTIRVGDSLYLTACSNTHCGEFQTGETVELKQNGQSILVKRAGGRKQEVHLITTVPADSSAH